MYEDFSHIKAVKVVPRISAEEFWNEYRLKGIPVVVTGNNENMEAVRKWTPEWFKKNYGDAEVNVHRGNILNQDNEEQEHLTLTMSQFVDWIRLHEKVMESDKFDFNWKSFEETAPALDTNDYDPNWQEDFTDPNNIDYNRIPYLAEGGAFFDENTDLIWDLNRFPMARKFSKHVDAYLWMGPKGARTGMHVDLDPFGLLYQIYGEKQVWLWSPEQTKKYLYPSSKYDYGSIPSDINPWDDPDYKKFPKYRDSHRLEVILQPGDMIYIPMGWMHAVTSLTTSISVSARGENLCQKVAYLPRIVMHRLHGMGLYKKGDCTCHDAYGDAYYV